MIDAAKAIQDRNPLFRNRCPIGGAWCGANSGRSFPVSDPATGDVIAEVPAMGAAETRRAIAAAHDAFARWSSFPAQERGDILMRWYDLMLQNEENLGRLMTAEQGKPLLEARGEIRYAASFVRFFAEEARRVYGETIPSPKSDGRIVVLRQPVGVVACITPWNFPAAMITRKAAPALAAGCTVVVKPAEATPLTALALAALAEQAGMPPGVVNMVTGDPKEIGAELCGNTAVRKLSFTGSTATGRLLAAQCAPSLKKLSFELGGNAPFIVFDDADLDAAIAGAVLSKYRHSGQTCVCTNRFLVQGGIHDDFARRLVAEAKKLKLGNGFEQGVTIGPLINDAAIAKVEAHVADALDKGAKLLVGGNVNPTGSHFFEPTVLSGITPAMRMMQEETFGPVAGLTRFEDEDDAVRIANDTEYGLAGYFYSRDFARTWRVAEKLECGMVGINTGFLSVETAPFGGIKQSGYGREGSHHGLAEFLQFKYLNIGEIR
ncbi:MAG: NAD-dependent succinate-semialdehyde dehydrogenase [Alphaproteobacteria bacterium]|nr:NAD-dependent succinate-semialdehyde dehydrogenase [Alphaproteobacteria bacterium]MDE2111386.1 NAD-dependent succinate-semialdehyde dehydrogenase [Alphaproteobacteria bacterium]MDE2495561.1 NAD-dependent succinate-semialdehyde dehydrogenase [Alphaproteobacteria bacterium]